MNRKIINSKLLQIHAQRVDLQEQLQGEYKPLHANKMLHKAAHKVAS